MVKARVVIKGISIITFWGGIALTFLKFVWELVARGQEVDQFVRDLPGFIRWFDRPFAGPAVIVVGLAIYGVLILYDSRVKAAKTVTYAPAVQAQDGLLVGKFFHTFRDGDDTFQFQGEVLREENGRLFVRLYDTLGYPSVQQYLTDEQTRSARFYDTPEEWREEGERLNRRAMGRH